MPIIIALMAVGLAASIAGTIIGGNAKAAEDRKQADLERINAGYLDTQARDVQDNGQYQAGLAKLKAGAVVGAQTAGWGASGFDVNSSESAVRMEADTRAMGAMDADTIKTNAMREAWGIRTKADNRREQAALDDKRADGGWLQTLLGGVAIGASGAASIAGKMSGPPSVMPTPKGS